MTYKCQKCGKKVGVIYLSQDKKWKCDKCEYNRKKVKRKK